MTTNLERIRKMTSKQLAEKLATNNVCDFCMENLEGRDCGSSNSDCIKGIKNWLDMELYND